ncbi:MAG: hypothetical protein KBF67_13805, partial [Flavobacteriales bacterium]|nr:hypothetical protein [Flavobacteriales bacterium]
MKDTIIHTPRSVAPVGWHRMQLHADDDALTNNICRHLCAALLPGSAAVVVAMREHVGWVRDEAPSWGLDLAAA